MSGRLVRAGAGIAALLGFALPLSAFQASIEGRVVNAVTGASVKRASLALTRSASKSKPVTAQSDDAGRFAFRDLEPGSYQLTAERSGYLKQAYGARLDPGAGMPLAVKAGQAIQDITFKLPPVSVIAGMVLDQEGEPMPNLMVQALRSGYARGRRQWISAGGAQTDDRGAFRLSNLRPGRYTLAASDLRLGIGLVGISGGALPERPEPGYSTTYYGNTLEASRAATIDLGLGEERRSATIQMVKTTTVRIRGKVTGAPEGKILAIVLLRKESLAAGSPAAALGVVQQSDGAFEVRNVTAGSYLLMAGGALEGMSPAGAPMPIEVGDQHLDNVVYRLIPGGELAGAVLLPGETATVKGVTVNLEMVGFSGFSLPNAPSGTADENGALSLKGVFRGAYRVRVGNLPEDAYLRSVKWNGQEVPDDGVEISAGAGRLEIQLSRLGGEVEGTAATVDGKPVSGAIVTLIPDSGRESAYLSTRSDPDGTFRLKAVPPGRYKAIAWEDVEPGAWRDAEFVKKFADAAQVLTLEEGARSKVALAAVPLEDAAKH